MVDFPQTVVQKVLASLLSYVYIMRLPIRFQPHNRLELNHDDGFAAFARVHSFCLCNSY